MGLSLHDSGLLLLQLAAMLAGGFCMNARGALEMVLASVAMVTTIASAPPVAFLGPGRKARFGSPG